MTRLKCDVSGCASNSDGLCAQNCITVNGRNANMSCDTCCESFSPQERGLFNRAAFRSADEETDVACTAEGCKFNCGGECGADDICVCGCHDPCDCSETECKTFRRK